MNRVWSKVMIVFVALFSLGQLQRWQITPTIAVYVHDLVVGLSVAVMLVTPRYRQAWLKLIRNLDSSTERWLWFAAGYVVLGLVGAWVRDLPVMSAMMYVLRLVLYLCFVVSLKIGQSPVPAMMVVMAKRVMAGGLLVLGLGLIQYLFLPDTRFLAILGWDDHYYRLISTMLDPAFAGMILVLTWVYLEAGLDRGWWWTNWHFSSRTQSWVSGCLRGSLILGILLTFSRSSYLAWLVGVSVLLVWSVVNRDLAKSKLLVIMVFFFLVGLPLLPKPAGEGVMLMRTSTITARSMATEQVWQELSVPELLVGRGLLVSLKPVTTATGVTVDHARVPDNLVMLSLSGVGVVGSAAWMWVMGRYLARSWQSQPYVVSAWLAVLTHSLFNNTLFQPFVWLYLCLGLILVLPLTSRQFKA